MTPPVLITRHEGVYDAVRLRHPALRHFTFYRPEILRDLPPGSLVIGSLPVPVAASICRVGHHYQHVVIPGASNPGSLTFEYLRRNMELVEFHVEEID
jgi:putative CRISPR-associated protein (TIGR02620 family)